MLNIILNQYQVASTICIVEVSVTYLLSMLSASLSVDLCVGDKVVNVWIIEIALYDEQHQDRYTL